MALDARQFLSRGAEELSAVISRARGWLEAGVAADPDKFSARLKERGPWDESDLRRALVEAPRALPGASRLATEQLEQLAQRARGPLPDVTLPRSLVELWKTLVDSPAVGRMLEVALGVELVQPGAFLDLPPWLEGHRLCDRWVTPATLSSICATIDGAIYREYFDVVDPTLRITDTKRPSRHPRMLDPCLSRSLIELATRDGDWRVLVSDLRERGESPVFLGGEDRDGFVVQVGTSVAEWLTWELDEAIRETGDIP